MLAALLRLCGMNAGDAAHFLGVARPVILQWWEDKGDPPPDEVFTKIYALIDRQEQVAEKIVEYWQDSGEPAELELVVSKTNDEARQAGWPCVAAERAPIAQAQALLVNVKIRLI